MPRFAIPAGHPLSGRPVTAGQLQTHLLIRLVQETLQQEGEEVQPRGHHTATTPHPSLFLRCTGVRVDDAPRVHLQLRLSPHCSRSAIHNLMSACKGSAQNRVEIQHKDPFLADPGAIEHVLAVEMTLSHSIGLMCCIKVASMPSCARSPESIVRVICLLANWFRDGKIMARCL